MLSFIYISRREGKSDKPNGIECFNSLPNTWYKGKAEKLFRELFEPENSWKKEIVNVIKDVVILCYGLYIFDIFLDCKLITAYSSQEEYLRNITNIYQNTTESSEDFEMITNGKISSFKLKTTTKRHIFRKNKSNRVFCL